jgi:glycosyltransferase involved in cell wall biosynthesis
VRIAHLDTGREWRGGQAQVLQLARGLRGRGHEQLLLAPPAPLLERARAEGLAVAEWRSRGELDLGAMWRARGLLRRFAPHVAHMHSAHAHALGVPAARAALVAGVVVSRRVDFDVARHAASALKYRLPVDRYICISEGVAEVLRRGGVPPSRLVVVPSGIDLARPVGAGADLRDLLGAGPSTPVVGTVAALAPHKDHATLMQAAARVVQRRPEVRFAWVGEGECRPALEQLRAQLGLERVVHLLGFREDARALLVQFTLFALSSYLEGLCTSLLDAQALGVPIVATRVGGIPEAVAQGEAADLVPARDPEALAGAIVRLLDDEPRRERLRAAGTMSVRRFDVSRTVAGTERVYREVLTERGVPS